MSHQLLDDPFVDRAIDDAMAPFLGLLVKEDLDWVRGQLVSLLQDDIEARALLQAAHPRNVDRSGEQLQPGADAAGEQEGAIGHG